MKTIRLFLIASFAMTGSYIMAQNSATIKGTVTDSKGKPMPYATVALMEDSTITAAVNTDDNGDYAFKQVVPGIYTLQFSFVGFNTKKVKKVDADPEQIAYVNTSMQESSTTLKEAEVVATYEKQIINPKFSTITPIKIDQIEHMAVAKGDIVAMIIAVTPAVMASEDGKNIYVRGSRSGSTQFIVDGNKVMPNSSPDVPGPGIASMEVLTGGVPAEYGDCTGGIVIITTKEYQWEMRRKEMERRARAEAEAEAKQEKAKAKTVEVVQ
ncbi:MAG: enterobactin receptor protein [Bacteroidetes bacterium]|nr:enterobactin receptor protein [Bacteroidota bacterium]